MTRRVVRLLVLLGVVAAVYLVLSLFDHAARADAGSIDQIGATDPVTTAAGAREAVPEPKSIIPKSTAPKTHPQRIHRPTIKTPEGHPPKVQAPSIRAGETVRRVQVRTSKLRQLTSDVVRDAARATVAPERMAVVRQKLPAPARLPSLPDLAELPRAELPGLSQLPSGLKLPSSPRLPGAPQAQLHDWSQVPGLPQARTPVPTRPTALPSAPVPYQPLMPPVSAQVSPLPQPPALASAPGLSGVTKPPAALAQPWTAPPPAPPRQPADPSTPTGQARDPGGGNAPAMGIVSSSWRPEVAAAGRRLATDLLARGRTVRYAGPPS